VDAVPTGAAGRAWHRAGTGALVAVAAVAAVLGVPRLAAPGRDLPVVVSGIPRPLQLAADGRTLVVLAAGAGGAIAGEIHRIDLAAPSSDPRPGPQVLAFGEHGPSSLGSLALRPGTGELYLGEENGRRIWRLDRSGRLDLYADRLARLAGGGTLAIDGAGHLLVLDHVDPRITPADEAPPGLEPLREEDYQGPVIFRLGLDVAAALPRRLDRRPPLFPRGWSRPAGGPLLPHLVAVAPRAGDVALLASSGEVFRLGADGRLVPHATLPVGQYVRANMVAGPDGSLYVSAGFWVARLFRVGPDAAVTTLAERLADPQGLVLVGDTLYLAESARHRIVRLALPSR
jgi:predicted Rdx family selenoprotein